MTKKKEKSKHQQNKLERYMGITKNIGNFFILPVFFAAFLATYLFENQEWSRIEVPILFLLALFVALVWMLIELIVLRKLVNEKL